MPVQQTAGFAISATSLLLTKNSMIFGHIFASRAVVKTSVSISSGTRTGWQVDHSPAGLFRLTWPRGKQNLSVSVVEKTTHNLDASELLWEFISRHSLGYWAVADFVLSTTTAPPFITHFTLLSTTLMSASRSPRHRVKPALLASRNAFSGNGEGSQIRVRYACRPSAA